MLLFFLKKKLFFVFIFVMYLNVKVHRKVLLKMEVFGERKSQRVGVIALL